MVLWRGRCAYVAVVCTARYIVIGRVDQESTTVCSINLKTSSGLHADTVSCKELWAGNGFPTSTTSRVVIEITISRENGAGAEYLQCVIRAILRSVGARGESLNSRPPLYHLKWEFRIFFTKKKKKLEIIIYKTWNDKNNLLSGTPVMLSVHTYAYYFISTTLQSNIRVINVCNLH